MPVFAPTIVEQRILRQLCPSSRNGILTAYAKFSILPQLIIGKTIEMPDRVAKCYCPNACTRICFANACPKLTWQPRKARSSEGPDSWLAWGRAVLVTVHVLYRHGQNRPKWPTSYSMLKGQGMGGGGAIPSGRRARQAAHDSYACAALAAGSPTQKSALGTVMWAVKGPAWDSSSARDAGVRAEKCISHARLSQAWAASRCQPLNGQRSTGASRRSGRGALPVGIKAGIAEVLSRQDCNGGGRQNTFTAQCSEEAVSCLIFVLMLLALRIDTNVFVTHVVADGLCCKTTRDHDFRWLRFVGLGAIHQFFLAPFYDSEGTGGPSPGASDVLPLLACSAAVSQEGEPVSALPHASARSSRSSGPGPSLRSAAGGNSRKEAAKARCAATARRLDHRATQAVIAAGHRCVVTEAARCRAKRRRNWTVSVLNLPRVASLGADDENAASSCAAEFGVL